MAYFRFAMVYRDFESADDFETEIAMLCAERADSEDGMVHLGQTVEKRSRTVEQMQMEG